MVEFHYGARPRGLSRSNHHGYAPTAWLGVADYLVIFGDHGGDELQELLLGKVFIAFFSASKIDHDFNLIAVFEELIGQPGPGF